MAAQTPLRVRGKRNAAPAEKWSHGKQRKAPKGDTTSTGSIASSELSTGEETSRKKRKRTKRELSRLEQLPTEVLQVIFILSTNVNLPLASVNLASQLDSRHLHNEIADLALSRILHKQEASAADLRNASRIIGSKFFTWDFFAALLLRKFGDYKAPTLRSLPDVLPEHLRRQSSALSCADRSDFAIAAWAWDSLGPHAGLLPPQKLFRAPFSQDRTELLATLTAKFGTSSTDRYRTANRDPAYYETARKMLKQAILEGNGLMVTALCRLGVRVETDHIRVAVMDANCEGLMVIGLLNYTVPGSPVAEGSPAFGGVDFLDPMLWAWAKKAGPDHWLKRELARFARLADDRGVSFGDNAATEGVTDNVGLE